MAKALAHLRAADPKLGGLIDCVGPFRPTYIEPVFSSLARSIVFQQLSGKVARTIHGRLEQALAPAPVDASGILALPHETLRGCGLSQQKIVYLRDLAGKTLDGTVQFAGLPDLPDDEVIAHLTSVKGIGVWTAHMFLIFALRRPDVLPTGDLGIHTAMKRIYRLRQLPKPARMEQIARPWRPFASIASWYLWRSLDNEAGL